MVNGPGYGWTYTRKINIAAANNGGAAFTGFQYPVKILIGSGTDAAYTHNGVTGTQIYVNSTKIRSDFMDARFYKDASICSFHRVSKTDGDNAIFIVELAYDASGAAGYIDVYTGNSAASTDLSSADDTYVTAPISGVVGAWTLDEADTDINRIVVADDTQTAFFDSATPVGMTVTDDAITKTDGVDSLKVVLAHVGAYQTKMHTYSVNQDWSSKQFLRFNMYGLGSGFQFYIHIYATNTSNRYAYTVTDDTAGWKTVTIPFSSFSPIGSPSWSTVKQIGFGTLSGSDYNSTVYFDRWTVDVGVSALDSSGNGNDGTATGTTIVTSPFYTGKTARSFGAGDKIATPDLGIDGATAYTWLTLIKPTITTKAAVLHLTTAGSYTNVFLGHEATATKKIHHNWFGADWISNKVLTDQTPAVVAWSYDATNRQVHLNGVGETNNLASKTFNFNVLTIGQVSGGTMQYTGIIGNIFGFNRCLSDAEISAFNLPNYPDVGLVAGSVCIRKWASTTNPAHSSVGSETEYSYSGEEGYYYQKYYYPNYHAQKKIAESKATTRQHELKEQAQKIVSNQVTEEYNKVITQNKRLMK